MKNILCQSLNIRYPILLGGMLQVGRGRLAAAVSEAGGLGIIGAGAWTKDELREQITALRERTDKPFGVNIPARSPRAPELVEVILEQKVPAVTTSAGDPSRYTRDLQKAGIYVMHVVPTVEHARKAQETGIDAIIAEGYESILFSLKEAEHEWGEEESSGARRIMDLGRKTPTDRQSVHQLWRGFLPEKGELVVFQLPVP